MKKKEAKSIGIDVKPPENTCTDRLCPFHGNIKLRGRTFVGRVISDRMSKTVTIEWGRTHFLPKFERFEKRRTRIKAHNPECINAKINDVVKVAETRPISKTKNFVVIEKIGKKEIVEAVDAGKKLAEKEKAERAKLKKPETKKEQKRKERLEKESEEESQ